MNNRYFIPQQLPEFIVQEYPFFVDFVKAYYEWFDNYQIGLIEDLVDVDDSIERFIKHFKYELDSNGVLYNNNNRLHLRRIKDLYKAKGSEASFDLFFKLVYKKPADVFYPWDKTLKVSDGKWVQDSSFFIKLAVGHPDDIVGKNIDVYFGDTSYNVFVDRYQEIQGFTNVFEFFIDRKWFKLIPGGSTVVFNGIEIGTTAWTTSNVKIVKKGKRFKVGEIYELNYNDGFGSFVKVLSVGFNGELLKCEIIRFGVEFQSLSFTTFIIPHRVEPYVCLNFLLTEDDDCLNQENKGHIRIWGRDSSFLLMEDDILNFDDEDFLKQEDDRYIIVRDFDKNCLDQSDYQAVIDVDVGAVSKYPGYYATNDGLLNDDMYIQDSFYYQVYSYVVQVDEQLKSYKRLLKQALHPSGLALFGEYSLNNTCVLNYNLDDDSVFNIKRNATDYSYLDDTITKHFTKKISTSINVDNKFEYVLGTLDDITIVSENNEILALPKSVECLDFIGDTFNNVLSQHDDKLLTTQKTSTCLSFLLQENGKFLRQETKKFIINDINTNDFCVYNQHLVDHGSIWKTDDVYWDVLYQLDADYYVDSGLVRVF